MAASRIGIRSWQELAAIHVRLKHRAQRQVYHKNQYHKLGVYHHLLTMAAKALAISRVVIMELCWHLTLSEGRNTTGYNLQ